MNIKCCKDCTDRKVGCHTDCERYTEERAELDKQKADLRKKKKGRYEAIAVRENRLEKVRVKCNIGQK